MYISSSEIVTKKTKLFLTKEQNTNLQSVKQFLKIWKHLRNLEKDFN